MAFGCLFWAGEFPAGAISAAGHRQALVLPFALQLPPKTDLHLSAASKQPSDFF